MNSSGDKSNPPKGNDFIKLHVCFIAVWYFTELLNISEGMNNYFHITDPPRMPIVLSNAVYFSKTYRSTNLRKNQDPQSARFD